jgi:hypothetical protein
MALDKLHCTFTKTIGALTELRTLQITYLDNGIEANFAYEFENESVTSDETSWMDEDGERDNSGDTNERDYTFRWRKFDSYTFAFNISLMAAYSAHKSHSFTPALSMRVRRTPKYSKLDVLICGVQFPHRPVLRPRMFAKTQEFHHGNGELVELCDREQDSVEYTSEVAKFDMFKYPVFREP